jgi:hypothetical protein
MSFNSNITPGRPPLLWSDVQEAFVKINENFDILVATIGDGSGLTPIDFSSLDTDVTPTTDNLRSLGSITNRWKAVYASEHTLADPTNGVFLGNAQIKGLGFTVNLPENSTIGGDPLTGIGTSLIIDPDKTFFKEIQVDNNFSIVATSFGDTVNLLSGSGINLTVSSGADSIEIDNTGILSVAAGVGMSVATVSGAATVTNTGVRSLQSTTALPLGRSTGAGININGTSGDNLRITNTGVISVTGGLGITVSIDVATGEYQVTNAAPAVNAFTQVVVNGDTSNILAADAASDILNITSDATITLSKTVGTDTLNIAVNPVFDLRGSVFADDSTVMVDAVSGTLRGIFIGSVFADDSSQIIDGNSFTVYGNIEATTLRTAETKIALGSNAGLNQGNQSVAIGENAGTFQGSTAIAIGQNAGGGVAYQNDDAVAIGHGAGENSQGTQSIAVGLYAGQTSQPANTIILNASGIAVNGVAAQTSSFYVAPIRTTANGTPLMYNSTTKEITYSTVLEFAGSTISTSDSSGLTVDVQTTFNTDVTVENDLDVTQRLRVQGSRVINITELKAIVAASADFAAFKTAIAALA